MVRINDHYLKLKAGYLFPEIGRRVRLFSETHPDAPIIKLGIGDVTEPLPLAAVQAAHEAFEEMSTGQSFKGYGPEQGYDFLREAIRAHDYIGRGVDLELDEIFVSDGSKCDTGNIQEIFHQDCKIAVSDPVYPVYVDTNVMAGRSGEDKDGRYAGITYLDMNAENNFIPSLPKEKVDVIYLCYPNNPTGAMISKEELKKWVDYAKKNNSLILYDVAYRAFITDPELPHSIYEIEGAKDCAIEFNSFSKNAGFTGTRCAYTIVPKALMGKDEKGNGVSLNSLWNRRQTTKFNGVSYPIQKAALACYTMEGKNQIRQLVDYYKDNAQIILAGLRKINFSVYGGEHSPYIWFKTPNELSSWDFFDELLHKVHVVGTPGAGFGACGEGYFRLSAFGQKEQIEEAIERIASQF